MIIVSILRFTAKEMGITMTTTAATYFKLIDLMQLLRFRINDNISVKKKKEEIFGL